MCGILTTRYRNNANLHDRKEVIKLKTNINILIGKMKEKGYTQDKLSSAINMHRSTLNKKLKEDGNCFTIKEANDIVAEMKLTKDEAISIFFAQ